MTERLVNRSKSSKEKIGVPSISGEFIILLLKQGREGKKKQDKKKNKVIKKIKRADELPRTS